jgi:hypothetical protein
MSLYGDQPAMIESIVLPIPVFVVSSNIINAGEPSDLGRPEAAKPADAAMPTLMPWRTALLPGGGRGQA